MTKSKWSYLNKDILKIYREDPSTGYSESARTLLGEDAEYSDVDALRTYIKRFLDRQDPDTFERDLDENNFTPPDNWSHGWLKTKEASIFIKNSNGGQQISFEEMRKEFIDELKEFTPSFKTIDRKPVLDPHCLVIDIADLHIGKLSSSTETGEDYNRHEAVSRAVRGVAGILNKSEGFPIDKIVFIIGNDVLHTDNAIGTTTAGTKQDTDGTWYDNYISARNLYSGIIQHLLSIADVHIIHCPSNHDYVTGFMLADSMWCLFKDCENVTFDLSMAHRKYYKYGRNLISASHGDGAKMEHLPLLMANESKQHWADTDYRYIYLHHIHHKDYWKFRSGKDYHGVTVEYLRSPSGTDSWHHKMGYQHSPKAVEGFIHHKDYGQVSRITHLF